MYRNRTWSFTSPVWRFNHNKIVNIDGYIPALQFIYWQPSSFVLLNRLTALGPIKDAVTISDAYQPFRFKWETTDTIPRNVLLYYRKNGGSWVLFAEKINTADTFNNGDTFQLGASTGNSTGFFNLILTNNIDGLPCAEQLSITVL